MECEIWNLYAVRTGHLTPSCCLERVLVVTFIFPLSRFCYSDLILSINIAATCSIFCYRALLYLNMFVSTPVLYIAIWLTNLLALGSSLSTTILGTGTH